MHIMESNDDDTLTVEIVLSPFISKVFIILFDM